MYLCIHAYIYIYIFIYTYIYASAYMYVHAFVYFPTQWRRKLNPMASYRIICFGRIQFQSYNVTRLEGLRMKSDLTLYPIDGEGSLITISYYDRFHDYYRVPFDRSHVTCEFQVALSGKRTEDLSRFCVRFRVSMCQNYRAVNRGIDLFERFTSTLKCQCIKRIHFHRDY